MRNCKHIIIRGEASKLEFLLNFSLDTLRAVRLLSAPLVLVPPPAMQTTLLVLLVLMLPLSHAFMRVPPASVARALPAARWRIPVPARRGRVAMDAFPERVDSYEDETTSLKAAIRVAHVAGDSAGLRALVESQRPVEGLPPDRLLVGVDLDALAALFQTA